MMLMYENFIAFEMQIGMNEFDQSILLLLKLNGDSNPDLWDTCAVLYQLSYHANWSLCGSMKFQVQEKFLF